MDELESRSKPAPGRRALMTVEHAPVLTAIAHELPRSSLDELTREFNRRTGLDFCSATVRKGLRQAGIKRMRPTRKPTERALVQGGSPLRVGYTERHRRSDGVDLDLPPSRGRVTT